MRVSQAEAARAAWALRFPTPPKLVEEPGCAYINSNSRDHGIGFWAKSRFKGEKKFFAANSRKEALAQAVEWAFNTAKAARVVYLDPDLSETEV